MNLPDLSLNDNFCHFFPYSTLLAADFDANYASSCVARWCESHRVIRQQGRQGFGAKLDAEPDAGFDAEPGVGFDVGSNMVRFGVRCGSIRGPSQAQCPDSGSDAEAAVAEASPGHRWALSGGLVVLTRDVRKMLVMVFSYPTTESHVPLVECCVPFRWSAFHLSRKGVGYSEKLRNAVDL